MRSRTPYCAALARARLGIDSAVAYQYQTPVIAEDFRKMSLASDLHKHYGIKKLERDIATLWDFATAGRDDVLALRTAANAPGLDEAQKNEMLGLANAIDGAKARQKMLAKSLAAVVGRMAELPVYNIANSAEDSIRSSNPFSGSTWSPQKQLVSPSAEETPSPSQYASLHPDTSGAAERSAALFSVFPAEYWIKKDMEVAAVHGQNAMALGNCQNP